MQLIILLLRLVHIVSGTFWVGSALLIALIILPGLRKSGPGSERVLPMAKISQALSIASLLTVAAGVLLYWLIYRFNLGWILTLSGTALTLGSLAGIAAFLIGTFSTGPKARRLAELGRQVQAAGGPPTPAQAQELGKLQAQLAASSTWSTILATVSLILMSVARYL
jgi:uncharacterized membrane protein